MNNFSFIIPNKLAGMSFPGAFRSIDEDLKELKNIGITGIVSLTENRLPEKIIKKYNFSYLHLPIPDFNAPTIEQIKKFVKFVEKEKSVVVHCRAGIGRTGTMLACYLVYIGYSPTKAIHIVRQKRPSSIETLSQENIIYEYSALLEEERKNK